MGINETVTPVMNLPLQYVSKPVKFSHEPLIQYHKRELFIGHERDLICIKYVICVIFIQLELCFHSVWTYCRIEPYL